MEDHRPDLYDLIEIIGPEDKPLPPWLTADWMPCPDCRANAFLNWLVEENNWRLTIAHDDGCPTYAQMIEVSDG